MAVSEVVAAYRLHSAQCTKLHNAPETRKSDSRFFLWLNLGSSLADQAVRNSETVLVYETPMLKRS